MTTETQLVVIGGGVVGLMTAYHASEFFQRVVLIDKSTIGNKLAASAGETRSIRNDYLQPRYVSMANEARKLWRDLETKTQSKILIDCGVLNIARSDITPALEKTYATTSYETLKQMNFNTKKFNKQEMQMYYPQFSADLGTLDVDAGMLHLPTITRVLLEILHKRGVVVLEDTNVQRIQVKSAEKRSNGQTVEPSFDIYTDNTNIMNVKNVVVTCGRWTNDILCKFTSNQDRNIGKFRIPISTEKPQWKYYVPPAGHESLYASHRCPVFAYLDVGIYGHPVYESHSPGFKVGFFVPPDWKHGPKVINCPEDFIEKCMPGWTEIKEAPMGAGQVKEQCEYHFVDDDEYVLGQIPGVSNAFVGCGWRGSGYKFAPLTGRALAQLAMWGGTIYDISDFTPARFERQAKL